MIFCSPSVSCKICIHAELRIHATKCVQRTIALHQYKVNLFPFSVIDFCEVVMLKPWTQYVWSKSGILFFFLATCATFFRIMTPYFTGKKYSAKDSVYIWFLVDCNARSALFITPGRICCKGNPKNQAQCDRSLLYLLLVASLRFSLVYLCVQFAFSAAALHFLVRWISRLIALWSKGVCIPSLHFFCEIKTEPWLVYFRPLANEDLFFYNDHWILYVWK